MQCNIVATHSLIIRHTTNSNILVLEKGDTLVLFQHTVELLPETFGRISMIFIDGDDDHDYIL